MKNVLELASEQVQFLPFGFATSGGGDGNGEGASFPAGAPLASALESSGGSGGSNEAVLHGATLTATRRGHNRNVLSDVKVPWCWKENLWMDAEGGGVGGGDGASSLNPFLASLHLPTFGGGVDVIVQAPCDTCKRPHCRAPQDATPLLGGAGILELLPSSKEEGVEGTAVAVGPSSAADVDHFVGGVAAAETEAAAAAVVAAAAAARRGSLGDDGFGGIDDTDDITGDSASRGHLKHTL